MAEFNFNIEEANFRVELISQTDTDCSSIFKYQVFSDEGETIQIDIDANGENTIVTSNGTDTNFSTSVSVVYNTSLFFSFSIQNSGIPGTFNTTSITLSNEDTGEDLELDVTRQSDAPKCESLVYTFDGLTDTPEDKDGQAGMFLKVSDDETAIEYVDINNAVRFQSDLDPNLEMPNDVGGLKAGTTIQDLNDLAFNLTEFVELQNFETIQAYISQQAYTAVSSQSTASNEVGTAITQTITVTLIQGNINNGNNSSAGTVVGNISSIDVLDPDGSVEFNTSNPPSNTVAVTMPAYSIGHGTNTWTVQLSNFAGTTTYTDNKGGTATVATIENAKSDTTRDDVTFSMTGLYKRFHYIGTEGNSPTTSSGVRALSNASLNTSNNGSWTVSIGSGASSAEFSFYVPQGKNFTVIDLGNLNLDITSDFTTTNITVNDAGGAGVNYEKITRFAGTLGYTNPTTFQITIS